MGDTVLAGRLRPVLRGSVRTSQYGQMGRREVSHLFRFQGRHVDVGDQWVNGPGIDLVGTEQYLMELLSRPKPRVYDVDRSVGVGNQPAGYIGDFHRRTHVKHERLTRTPDRPGLDDQLNRFLDGHEVASDFRMGNGHGSPRAICSRNAVRTEPRLPSTFPNRTLRKVPDASAAT